ncbi:MAG: hypothetical protein A3F78_09390 [Burkholderiales bacterium RIFCSPLOWO2_12_FULL_61_40]|nr:MAG: hypothetical protein A3F78_09390 [Burkholderiales bacterium RIFCSPLOWO2_12_FULL_61_40]
MNSVAFARWPALPALRVMNLAASAALVALACAIYLGSPYNTVQLTQLYGPPSMLFRGDHFLQAAALVYAVLLALYYLAERSPRPSKSLRFFQVAWAFLRAPAATWRQGLTSEQRLAVLATLLKGFFGPMMVVSLMDFCMGAWVHALAILATGGLWAHFGQVFNRHGFWFAMQLILFVDVLVFTVGYLVESPRLGNEIRSVDPTWLGWAVAMVCYPPFNQVTVAILGSYKSEFPTYDNPTVHLVMNLLLLLLMALYASASVALGLKASNLTYRGIVARGPYAVVRHPAYTCKNMAWWIGSAPLVAAAFGQSLWLGLQALGSVLGWTLIYTMRALTEEDHLRRVDGDYALYAQRVRYRFLPGLL